jgi:hypothetical protein
MNSILLIFALVLAILAAMPVPTWGVSLGWLAFAFFVAHLIFGGSLR